MVECAIGVLGRGTSLIGLHTSVHLQPGDLYDFRVEPLHMADEDGQLEAWDPVDGYGHCGYNLEESGDVHVPTEGAMQCTVSHLAGDLGVE